MDNNFIMDLISKVKELEVKLSRTASFDTPLSAKSLYIIMNPEFQWWQRFSGTHSLALTSAATAYGADRWRCYLSDTGTAACTISRQLVTGLISINEDIKYCLRWNQTNAGTAGGFNQILQWVKGSNTLAGKNATLSFYAKANVSLNLGVYIQQYFGVGGDANVSTGINSSVALTTSWQRFTLSGAFPSVAGKVIGTNDGLTVTFAPGSAIQTIDITGVQLEEGLAPTTYKALKDINELERCFSYYQTSFSYGNTPNQNTSNYGGIFTFSRRVAGAVAQGSGALIFPHRFIILPTMTFYNPSAANAFVFNLSGLNSATTTSFSNNSEKGGEINYTPLAGGATGDAMYVHWSGNAEPI